MTRVLVTGGTGFLGGHLLAALVRDGVEAHAVVRPSASNNPGLLRGVQWHPADLLDAGSLAHALDAARPDVVFHLAAYGTTGAQTDEDRMFRVNVEGTKTLWQALGSHACRVVQTGTCAEYGRVSGPIGEGQRCQPLSWYPATIHAGVTISMARAAEAGRELVVLRPFGPYGANDRPERLIPYVIRQLLAGGHAQISRGDQVRDYSHVDDHVRAMRRAADAALPEPVVVYNVGSGRPVRVRELVEIIAREIGGGADRRVAFGDRPLAAYESPEMYADVAAATRDLGYVASIGLADGLRQTIASYREPRLL